MNRAKHYSSAKIHSPSRFKTRFLNSFHPQPLISRVVALPPLPLRYPFVPLTPLSFSLRSPPPSRSQLMSPKSTAFTNPKTPPNPQRTEPRETPSNRITRSNPKPPPTPRQTAELLFSPLLSRVIFLSVYEI